MKRRDHIRTLLVAGVGSSLLLGQSSCKEDQTLTKANTSAKGYGRTPEEMERDAKLQSETFFNADERKTVEVLVDIIIPKDAKSGSANDAKVPDFIDFMMRDQPNHQLQMRGGLRWLDAAANKQFSASFTECKPDQQLSLIDQIAFPEKAKPEMKTGVAFFNLLRNLTVTGFFTSEMGIADLGYQGNKANEWDGVPAEVLKKHGLSYDEKTLKACVQMKDRNTVIQWDDQGNIIG